MRTAHVCVLVMLAGCTRLLGIEPLTERSSDIDGAVPTGELNLVFATDDPVLPTSLMPDPVAAADMLCATAAAGAGKSGHFVARTSTASHHPKDALGAARGWMRQDLQPFADTVESILAGNMLMPVSLTARGTRLTGGGVITGTTGPGATGSTCTNWTEPTAGFTSGDPSHTGRGWTDFGTQPCSVAFPLYCFQTDYTTQLEYSHATGRLAFLSVRGWQPGSGIPAADAVCQADADAAGKSGTRRSCRRRPRAPRAASTKQVHPGCVSTAFRLRHPVHPSLTRSRRR